MSEPAPPGHPDHNLVTWSAYKQHEYAKYRRKWHRACLGAGLLPHAKQDELWNHVDIGADNPSGLLVDELVLGDG